MLTPIFLSIPSLPLSDEVRRHGLHLSEPNIFWPVFNGARVMEILVGATESAEVHKQLIVKLRSGFFFEAEHRNVAAALKDLQIARLEVTYPKASLIFSAHQALVVFEALEKEYFKVQTEQGWINRPFVTQNVKNMYLLNLRSESEISQG